MITFDGYYGLHAKGWASHSALPATTRDSIFSGRIIRLSPTATIDAEHKISVDVQLVTNYCMRNSYLFWYTCKCRWNNMNHQTLVLIVNDPFTVPHSVNLLVEEFDEQV